MNKVHQNNHHNSVDDIDEMVYNISEVIFMLNGTKNVRFTTTLPQEYLDALKELAKEHTIPSVNFGIKEAIDDYLKQIKKAKYEAEMQAASKDKDFLERTYECAEDFKILDGEVFGEW